MVDHFLMIFNAVLLIEESFFRLDFDGLDQVSELSSEVVPDHRDLSIWVTPGQQLVFDENVLDHETERIVNLRGDGWF